MADNLPLVSIVTPTFNQAQFLGETIESILGQDYPNIELIVLDDGSTDNTQEVLSAYQGKLLAVRHDNMGQARTLNKGWAMAQGKYIGYLSSDDILYDGAISKLVSILEDSEAIAVVYPNCHLIDPDSRVIKRNVSRDFDYDDLVIAQNCYIGPGALFRKSIIEELGGWQPDLKLAPDREFWMRVGLRGKFKMVDEPLAGYRMHANSISYYETNPRIATEYFRVLDSYFARNDVPAHLVARRSEAYANAKLILCRMFTREGKFKEALACYRDAVDLNPTLPRLKTMWILFRTSISKPIRRFLWQVRSIFAN
jgi:glycosyltransferase involved in cell wall biosynthesis